jgi:endo-1,4-beta-xylanase
MACSRKSPTGMGLWLLLTALLAIFPLAAVGGPTAAPTLPPNQTLLESTPELFRLTGQSTSLADARIVSLQGPAFDRAWRIEVRQQPADEFQLQLVSPVADQLHRGDTLLLSVWARAADSSNPDHQGCIGLVLEQSADPYDKVLNRRFDLGSDWQRLDVAAKVNQDFGRIGAQVALRLGYFPQTVEVGGVELRRFDPSASLAELPQTPVTYRGREADAAWRRDAENRIESLRTGLLTVRVTDSTGHPMEGAAIKVRMTRHAFAFGCVYNDSRLVGTHALTADSQAYQEHFLELFNTGVDEAGMKWPSWENPASRQKAMQSLQWMRDHNIAVRGHNIIWPGWHHLPSDLPPLANDRAALESRIDDHIRDITTSLAGQVIEWDVVNEPQLNHDLMHILGDDALTGWFKLARQCDPNARLYLNETPVPTVPPRDERYDVLFNRVRALQQEGAPIGGIGMESHFGDGLISPVDLIAIYDRFATLGIPIRITELDIDATDEQLQADYFRDFLTVSFSHPEINGILLWGFWEDQDWRPDAALFRKDWTIKPNGQVWKDLVLGKWWTRADGFSAADGTYSTRGFLGDYELKVTAGNRSQSIAFSLPHEGRAVDVVLK